MFELITSNAAIIASVWIIFGVFVVAKYYPNYSHAKQFCSELGAKNSPTEKLSPRINNYPLGLLFSLFGWHVIALDEAPVLIIFVAWLIIIHGIGTWIAGYFPMDADPNTKSPTMSCKIHSWAGFLMLLSLLVAPVLVAASGYLSVGFRVFSITTVFFTCYFCIRLAKAFQQQTNPGTYQRLAYGMQLLWLSAFSLAI